VGRLSKGITDSIANAVAVAARGRAYRITRLPSTARNCQAGTHWIGMLGIEEHEYDTNLADVCSEEAY